MADQTSPKTEAESAQLATPRVDKAAADAVDLSPADSVKFITSPETNGHTEVPKAEKSDSPADNNSSRPAHVTLKYDTSIEAEIRTLITKARTGEVTANSDLNNLALLTANLVQLMNASYIAKDVIVHAVVYMRCDDQISPQRALSQAYRDRRNKLRGKENSGRGRQASNALENVKNNVTSHEASNGTLTPTEGVSLNGNVHGLHNEKTENTASATADAQASGKNKKKRNWGPHRRAKGPKGGAGPDTGKVQATETNGIHDAEEVTNEKDVKAASDKESVTEDQGVAV